MSGPKFSIVTPSYNMLTYLQRCHRSIVDQDGADVEHIVVDGGSSDGTVEWLSRQNDLRFVSEPDEGMYDAINKGLRMCSGDIVAYLNCDEQYLPNVLSSVAGCFARRPRADVVFGDALVIDSDGHLLAYRKSHTPRRAYIWTSYLYTLSCATFVRRGVIERGFRYDTQYQAVADADFVLRLLQAHHRFVHLREYLAAFTVTGGNKIREATSVEEVKSLRAEAPTWMKVSTAALYRGPDPRESCLWCLLTSIPFILQCLYWRESTQPCDLCGIQPIVPTQVVEVSRA